MKQINSHWDLISMSSFAGPSYLTIRSSVCIILIWDPCIFNFATSAKLDPVTCAGNLTNVQITRVHFLLSQPSIRPVPAQVILLCKGPPKLCIECHLVPLWAFPPKSLVMGLVYTFLGWSVLVFALDSQSRIYMKVDRIFERNYKYLPRRFLSQKITIVHTRKL